MRWQVLLLKGFQEDLSDLAKRHGIDARALEADVVDEFEDEFRGARVDKLLEAGVSTTAIDRLSSSAYPPSIRLQVRADFRATAWLFPAQHQAILTHIFHKSSDSEYRRAAPTHDARLLEYIGSLHDFVEKKRRK